MIERETSSGIKLVLRDIEPDDVPYVVNSWLMTHGQAPSTKRMRRDQYFVLVRPVVERLLADRSLVRTVAVPEDDGDMIAGFVVADVIGPVLHFLKVRDTFRNLGVARVLLDHVGITKQTPFVATFDTRDLRNADRFGWTVALRPELIGGAP